MQRLSRWLGGSWEDRPGSTSSGQCHLDQDDLEDAWAPAAWWKRVHAVTCNALQTQCQVGCVLRAKIKAWARRCIMDDVCWQNVCRRSCLASASWLVLKLLESRVVFCKLDGALGPHEQAVDK